MNDSLSKKTCEEFTALLASDAPVPGGGGAAALTGALAAALCSMSARFTLGRKKFAAVEGEAGQIAGQAEALRLSLLALIDADAAAFIPLSAAYAVKRDEPGREELLRGASLAACAAPLETLRCCCETVGLLERMLEIGNPMLVSDLGCAGAVCEAAMQCAALNAYVNTRAYPDDAQAARINAEVGDRLGEYAPRARRLIALVTGRLEK